RSKRHTSRGRRRDGAGDDHHGPRAEHARGGRGSGVERAVVASAAAALHRHAGIFLRTSPPRRGAGRRAFDATALNAVLKREKVACRAPIAALARSTGSGEPAARFFHLLNSKRIVPSSCPAPTRRNPFRSMVRIDG